ncbi:hypothetical protein C2845_PM13G08830 [Panicum miliaceum]|uniref:Uncharacterized protein n=1 Tax=Panicum miliaceum TaxID=4540 RepID=A0A3L6RJC6_PANMI|nr:hypothetical protein C2845_PM13G08830 [Panicum miliaceum]
MSPPDAPVLPVVFVARKKDMRPRTANVPASRDRRCEATVDLFAVPPQAWTQPWPLAPVAWVATLRPRQPLLRGPHSGAPEFPHRHPSRRPSLVFRTVARSVELQLEDDRLAAHALVVLVVGKRPTLAPYQVRRFIQRNYDLDGSSFTLHRYWPEDFLIIFRNAANFQHVLDAPPLPRADVVLRFRKWSRLSMAEGDTMRYRVLVEIRGIPSNAWSATTAQIILGGACADLR